MRTRAYTCSAGPISIRLSLDVVSNLALAATEAWKSVPRRGLEIGGILRGRRVEQDGQPTLVIDGFERVESEHRFGPSYKLSESDLQGFDQAARSHPGFVGIYRTHTRPEPPLLQDDDAVFFHRYFNGSEGVFLLIHPATSQAEFFLPEGDGLASGASLPFRVWDLAPGPEVAEVAERPVPVASIPAAQLLTLVSAEPAPAATYSSAFSSARRSIPPRVRVWTAVGAVFLLGAAVLAAKIWSRPAVVSATPAVAEASSPGRIGLAVTRNGESLRFQWDQDSSTIRSADRGKLEITDGNHRSELNLDAAELSSGLLSYWPDSPDVTVELQVSRGAQTISESIHAPPPVLAAVTGEADRSAEPDNPVPAAPPKKARIQPPPDRVAPRSLRTDVTVEAEPVDGARQRFILSRIPLLRRLKKHPQLYVPPAPVHRVAPSVSTREWHPGDRELPVDVRVSVGQTGRVQGAELLAGPGGKDRDLANAALYAARLWDFAPARLGNDKVPGEVVLHFRFGPRESR